MNKHIEAIRGGIKGEMDSINLYQGAHDAATDEQVKSFFADRVAEEKRHYNYLVKHMQLLKDGLPLLKLLESIPHTDEAVSEMISDEFCQRIAGNQILFSAISTAVLLEKNAIDYYHRQSQEVDDPILREFFTLMEQWEKQHYDDVLAIMKQSEEAYWRINRFEPF